MLSFVFGIAALLSFSLSALSDVIITEGGSEIQTLEFGCTSNYLFFELFDTGSGVNKNEYTLFITDERGILLETDLATVTFTNGVYTRDNDASSSAFGVALVRKCDPPLLIEFLSVKTALTGSQGIINGVSSTFLGDPADDESYKRLPACEFTTTTSAHSRDVANTGQDLSSCPSSSCPPPAPSSRPSVSSVPSSFPSSFPSFSPSSFPSSFPSFSPSTSHSPSFSPAMAISKKNKKSSGSAKKSKGSNESKKGKRF